MNDLDKTVARETGWPYPWIVLRNAESRRMIRCERCFRHKRVPRLTERDALAFARLAADFLVRHRGCVQKVAPA